MMDLQLFKNNGWEIRTLEKGGEPWLIARDVCDSLHLSNVTETLKNVDEEDKEKLSTNIINTEVGGRGTWIINESGLYSIILRSRKEEGKPFRRWVTSEVLPAIRKTGSYQHNIPQTLGDALQLAANQAKQLEEQAHLVEFAEAVSVSSDNITLNEMAKLSGKMGRNNMMATMREEAILMASNLPYQTFISRGYFLIYESVVKRSNRNQIVLSTQVTPKGQSWMIKKVNGWVNNAPK